MLSLKNAVGLQRNDDTPSYAGSNTTTNGEGGVVVSILLCLPPTQRGWLFCMKNAPDPKEAVPSLLHASAISNADASDPVRKCGWALLALYKQEPRALISFCLQKGLSGNSEVELVEKFLEEYENVTLKEKNAIRRTMWENVSLIRQEAMGRDIGKEPKKRAWLRATDLESKIHVAFSGKKQGSKPLSSITLFFQGKKTARKVEYETARDLFDGKMQKFTFTSPSDFLSEYYDPYSLLRSQRGYRQQEFIDALDRYFATIGFWEDICYQEEPVGWYKNGREN